MSDQRRMHQEGGLRVVTVEPELTLKILMVGGAHVGKTSLIRCYKGKGVAPYNQTLGSDLHVVPVGTLGRRKIYTKFIDVGHAELHGTEGFLSATTANVSGVLLVFDVADRASVHELDAWVALLRAYVPGLGKRVPVFVIAHKADMYFTQGSPPLIQESDLKNFVDANEFNGWHFTSTKGIPRNNALGLRLSNMSEVVDSLVGSALNSALRNHNALQQRSPGGTKEKTFVSGNTPERACTLEQWLSLVGESTYIQIPLVPLPVSTKVEPGSVLTKPLNAIQCFHLGREFQIDKTDGQDDDHANDADYTRTDVTRARSVGQGFEVVDRALKEALDRIAAEDPSFTQQKRKLLSMLQQRLSEQKLASPSTSMSVNQQREWQAILRLC
eukprot:g128.t1